MHLSPTNTDPATGSKDVTKTLTNRDMLEGFWFGKKEATKDRTCGGEPFGETPTGHCRHSSSGRACRGGCDGRRPD